jgi:tetratricopeptide (TPR) repeat protein
MKKLIFPMLIIFLAFTACKQNSQITGAEDEYELLKIGYNRVAVKDYKGGIQIFTKILEINTENAEALAYRGLCKYHLKDFEGAIMDYNSALEIQPGYAEVYDLRGIAKGELGDKEGACDDWKKAFEFGLKDAFDLIKEFCWDEESEN